MKIFLFLLSILIIGINLIIGAFSIGIYNEMKEANKNSQYLSQSVEGLKEKHEEIKISLNKAYAKTDLLNNKIENNKTNVVINIDRKITKLSSDIRSILAQENGKANSKLNDIKINLDKLYSDTKKGLDTHDGNFGRLSNLLKEYAHVAKFIHAQSKNGMTLRRLKKPIEE